MATTMEGQGKNDPHVDRGFDKRFVWAMIGAGILFVLIFIYLAFAAFSPDQTPTSTSGGAQQTSGGSPTAGH